MRGEWQEKLLALRLENLLGPASCQDPRDAVLWLILHSRRPDRGRGLAGSHGLDVRRPPRLVRLGRPGDLLALARRVRAQAELWRRSKGLYFLRHFVIDFLASLPFGFLSYQIDAPQLETGVSAAAESLRLLRFLRLGRLVQLLRSVRVVSARGPAGAVRTVPASPQRPAGPQACRAAQPQHRPLRALSRPAARIERPPSPGRASERARARLRPASLAGSTVADRLRLAGRVLADLDIRIETLPAEAFDGAGEEDEGREGREIPVEALVDRLIQLSPERLIDRMGPGFVTSADRYLRLLDAPVLRRLPVIRNLVAYRQKSPAEAVTLAANYLGHLIQRFLEVIYFLADLQGTLSPPVFLDRLGATIVSATRTPAKRLLWMGSAFLLLFLVVNGVALFRPFRGFVDRLQNLLGWPVIVLGVICLVFWLLGSWFRKIANQSADFCERVVEAQFAAQTKNLKSRRRDQDAQFLAERVIDPEIRLRSSDDLKPEIYRPADEAARPRRNRRGWRTASWSSCRTSACSIRTTWTARRFTAATPRPRCSSWATSRSPTCGEAIWATCCARDGPSTGSTSTAPGGSSAARTSGSPTSPG